MAPAEWEADESQWKYRIDIQRRIQSGQEEIIQDLTNGMTFRSLSDFYWLEQALHSEYHGALLIPSLSIALGVPDLKNCQHEVDAPLLTNWLSDILNGIRGQGEWKLTVVVPGESWQMSEAMEAFMYRADLQTVDALPNSPLHHSKSSKWEDGHGGLLKWIAHGDMCGLSAACAKIPNGNSDGDDDMVQISPALSPSRRKHNTNLPLSKQKMSSGALGDARSLDIQDSFVDHSPSFDNISRRTSAKYTDLIQAEKELIWNWRMRALAVMDKIQLLENEERNVAGAWKRYAISISNLFSFEKEVESARLGDSKTRKELQIPYRKLQQSTVDDMLRIFAKQKMERCIPGLQQLSIMVGAYVADLSSVQPAVDAYLDALRQLSLQAETVEKLVLKDIDSGMAIRTSTSTLKDQIQAGLDQVKKQLVVSSGDTSAVGGEVIRARGQLQTLEHRVLENEELLKEHLTRLCKAAPIRSARMAHHFLQVETLHTGALHGSAININTRTNVASKDTLSKMIHRHGIEVKEDREAEINIVQRMLNLGSSKKFLKLEDDTEEVERGVEINKESMRGKFELRDRAIQLCRERIGRWDSKVAMTIMEAVGVEDVNVRVEETTRELRLVRKLAIGLREHVERSTEALDVLRLSISQGSMGDLRKLRRALMVELQTLFAGAYQPMREPDSPLNIQLLIEQGIPCNDPMGWRRQQGGCGGYLSAYFEGRDSEEDWLLKSFGDLLKDYHHRLESLESFVYMECLGIQLEKHFSQRRAAALAAFEKKTDITSAINIATRKRMPVLVKELQAKLETIGTEISHTTVKAAKEAHLESKALKQELHDLSMRQLTRTRETSTERAIALMTLWSKEEESSSSGDLQRVRDLVQCLEHSVGNLELRPFVDTKV